jgi:hypothetical protein
VADAAVIDVAVDAATDAATDAAIDAAIDAMQCPAGTSACHGACVDLASDPSHCGTCERTCDTRLCTLGKCVEYFGQRTGMNGQKCTPNTPPPFGQLKQRIRIPYPVIIQKLGVVFRLDGGSSYKQKIYSMDDPGAPLAETPSFGPRGPGVPIETPLQTGGLPLEAGDYLVSIIVNDGCVGTMGDSLLLWAVALH